MQSVRYMHDKAVAAAVKAGPRKIMASNGETFAVYKLTFDELRRLFVSKGYNPNRSAWRKNIAQWGDPELWGELVPNNVTRNDSAGWSVVFFTVSESDVMKLRRFAEDNNIKAAPWEAREAMQVCQSSN